MGTGAAVPIRRPRADERGDATTGGQTETIAVGLSGASRSGRPPSARRARALAPKTGPAARRPGRAQEEESPL